MQRERPLDADAERVLADGERLAGTGALPLEDDAFEDLNPLARAFDDAEVHPHRVARLEARDLTQLAALDVLDDGAHGKEGPKAARIVANSANRDAARRPVRGEHLADQALLRHRSPGPRVA